MRRSTSRSSQADRRTGGQTLWFALLVLSASPPIRLSAQELANNAGALFLLFPVGAQAVAMGQTAATLDGRGEAAFWNPAGLATIERGELALNSASLAAGATHALTVYYPSHRFGVLGGAVYLVDYGDLDRTDSASNTIARIAPRNIEFLASYATALAGSVTLGINVGYQRLLRLRGGYAFVRDGLSGPSVGMGVTSGSIGVDLARAFLTGSDLVAQNPTFFSFRVVF